MRFLVLFLLSGCVPYIAAEHKSDPSLDNDGYDLACIGVKNRDRLQVKAGYCKNARGGSIVEARIEYELIE